MNDTLYIFTVRCDLTSHDWLIFHCQHGVLCLEMLKKEREDAHE